MTTLEIDAKTLDELVEFPVLDWLRQLRDAEKLLAGIREEMQQLIEQVMTAEQRMKIEEIKAEYEMPIIKAENQVHYLKQMAKGAVIAMKKTASAYGYQVAYKQARFVWDTDALDELVMDGKIEDDMILSRRKMKKESATIKWTAA